ncbi:MAG: phosphoribosylformylglycinamidine synthase subunit PurS [Ignisphaera sp.]|nr:phosphoribosylformylglycinamidine synthase subunit PurS [Ignisphaera sp.]MDW8084731.1 phosphoribosylformylglycinamidine synthase subunit PurS [Ignisphaera sp.]
MVKNKHGVRDPEGETIHRHLILRKGYSEVKSVRVGKYIAMDVEAETREQAIDKVRELCERLRLYNPIVHDVEVRVYG